MAPQRQRVVPDDSRSETSSSKEKQILVAPSKARRIGNLAAVARNSSLKGVAVVAPLTLDPEHDEADPLGGINWSSFNLSVLHAYRQAHRLKTPSAFSSVYNQRILSRAGIGWSSPTMAAHRERRRVNKEHLAMAVRKDFNDAMVHESEAITAFLYSVHNQDKNFRMRFATPLLK